jgi:hypothetical protein
MAGFEVTTEAKRYPDELLHTEFGLVRLMQRTSSFPWATP